MAKIEIVPAPPVNGNQVRGRRHVLIDGKPWAVIHMDSHGPRGVSYWFEQVGRGGPIEVPYGDKSDDFITFKVYSDNQRHGRISKILGGENEAQPTDVKLLAAVNDLIFKGLLIDPKKAVAERHAAQSAYEQARIAAESAAEYALVKHAAKIASNYSGAVPIDKLTAEIVKAMKWAQTQ